MNELIFHNKVVFVNGIEIPGGQSLALPVSATNPPSPVNGHMYYNSVDSVAKIYQNGVWETLSVGGGGSSYSVNRVTLNSTDILNKYVTLTGIPTTPSDTILNIVGGVIQEYTADYTVIGNQLSWNALGLEALLASGDILLVQFS